MKKIYLILFFISIASTSCCLDPNPNGNQPILHLVDPAHEIVSLDDRLDELQEKLLWACGQGFKYSAKGAAIGAVWIYQLMLHASS